METYYSLKIIMSIADFQGKSWLIPRDRNVVEAKAEPRSTSDISLSHVLGNRRMV
jgi:hypothetical protein